MVGTGLDRAGAEGAGQDKGNLGFRLGLEAFGRRERTAVGDAHIVEENTEIGLVDPELNLHRLRRLLSNCANEIEGNLPVE